MDGATTLMAYSMSKTISAAAVLRLVEAGRVGLEDPVERYVESLPYGPRVTVRQLLCHTSGIPNPIPLRWVHAPEHHATFDEEGALAAVLRRHPRLSFPPGTRYAYSNIGYWLLGRVVEQASGEPFSSYVADGILRPLGLGPREMAYVVADPARHATGYLERFSFLNLARGFLIDREFVGEPSGRWMEIRPHYVNGPAFGGLVGTAKGFARFLQDQLADRSVLFNDETRRLISTEQRTLRGTPAAMTLGWHVGDLGGTRFLYKEGAGGGFRCMMRLYPGQGIGTVVMTNATRFGVGALLDALDESFLLERTR